MPKKHEHPLHKGQCKDTKKATHLQRYYQYLFDNVATSKMASVDTGLPIESICRYKRKLEKQGLLRKVKRKPCQHTGHKAWYLTTDKATAPTNIPFPPQQLTLFQP